MKAQRVSETQNFTRGIDPYKKLSLGDNNLDHWRRTWNNKAIYRWLFYVENFEEKKRMKYIVDQIYSRGITRSGHADMIWFNETLLLDEDGDHMLDQESEFKHNQPKEMFDPDEASFWRKNDEQDFKDYVDNFGKTKVDEVFVEWFDPENERSSGWGLDDLIKNWMRKPLIIIASEEINLVKNQDYPQYFHSDMEFKEI